LKLLFDQNISPKIVKHLNSIFPDSTQVRHVGLEDASDEEIFNFAKSHEYSIVTFDSDFVDLNTIKGTPPKIIWLRTGNMTTSSIALLLDKNITSIKDFLLSKSDEILEIN
jgi:predicted nuclease of predicted toxin-antitoxin system